MKKFKEFLIEKQLQKRYVISCDVDGVLLDFIGGIKKWADKTHPEYDIKINIPGNWYFGVDKKLAWKMVEEFWATDELSKLPQYPGAKTGFNRLAKNFEVHIVTALDAKYKAKRVKNLSGFNYESMTVKAEGKFQTIVNKIKPDIAIEDKPELIQRMTRAGIDVYWPNLPLTKGVAVGTKYKNWPDLVKKLERKYLK